MKKCLVLNLTPKVNKLQQLSLSYVEVLKKVLLEAIISVLTKLVGRFGN